MKRLQMHIGGEWIDGAQGDMAPVISPATGEVVAEVPMGTEQDVHKAVEAANKARTHFAKLTVFERAELLHAVGDSIEKEHKDIAKDLAAEQGKPYHTEALGEVRKAIGMWHQWAEDIKRLEGEVLSSLDPAKRIFTIRQPRGVYAVITPWNFPAAIPSEHIAPALATGNTVVWKPSEYTPITAANLMRCLERAGVPQGVVNLVTGLGVPVGDELVRHPDIHGIALTGSSATGEAVARAAGVKAKLLELGGNGPTIIFADANIEKAVERTAFGCWANAGQICDSTERILVHEKVHDQVVEGLLNSAKTVRLGTPFDTATTMGPLNNQPVADKVVRHMDDARDKGAEILIGGRLADGVPTQLFYEPTVIDGVTSDMLLSQEETFGPVAPVQSFSDDDEALALANECELGLAAGVFTSSLARAMYFSEKLEVGVVNVNETCMYWQPHTPFGGYSTKRSGIGRLGGKYSLMEMTQIKTVVLDLENVAS